jgi:hypothetical protein
MYTLSKLLGHRTPSIHFLGHDGWAARLKGHDNTSAKCPPAATSCKPKAATKAPSGGGGSVVKKMAGTASEGVFIFTQVSSKEMDAIQLGFAEEFL